MAGFCTSLEQVLCQLSCTTCIHLYLLDFYGFRKVTTVCCQFSSLLADNSDDCFGTFIVRQEGARTDIDQIAGCSCQIFVRHQLIGAQLRYPHAPGLRMPSCNSEFGAIAAIASLMLDSPAPSIHFLPRDSPPPIPLQPKHTGSLRISADISG